MMIPMCPDLAVPMHIMKHVVNVESSGNPYAIGVVKGRLSRQPKNLAEALATVKILESKGMNFSVGIAQVNRYNLKPYGLRSYEQAFQVCPNLRVGTRILRECYDRSRDWGKAFSCYYSGNFSTGYKHGYVQKVMASIRRDRKSVATDTVHSITVIDNRNPSVQSKVVMSAKKVRRVDAGRSLILADSIKSNIPKPKLITDMRVSGLPSYGKNDKISTPHTIAMSQNNNRAMGIAEIAPKIHEDNAFVF